MNITPPPRIRHSIISLAHRQAQLRNNYRTRLLEANTAKSCIASLAATFHETHHLVDDMIAEYKGDELAQHEVRPPVFLHFFFFLLFFFEYFLSGSTHHVFVSPI